MTITIESLRSNMAQALAQAEQHKGNMNAAIGAAQAYEQLLSTLLQERREEVAKAEAAYNNCKTVEQPNSKPATDIPHGTVLGLGAAE